MSTIGERKTEKSSFAGLTCNILMSAQNRDAIRPAFLVNPESDPRPDRGHAAASLASFVAMLLLYRKIARPKTSGDTEKKIRGQAFFSEKKRRGGRGAERITQPR
jgi:hypothetical protein